MTDFNEVRGIGRITADAELSKLKDTDISVLKFSVVMNRDVRKPGSKESVKKAVFVNLAVFEKYADSLYPHLKKGKQILFEGYLDINHWENDGKKFSTLAVKCQKIQLLGGGEKKNLEEVADIEISGPENSTEYSITEVDYDVF